MPIRKQDYHPEWPRISKEIREAAGQKCEWCGVPNGKHIQRTGKVQTVEVKDCSGNKTGVVYSKDWVFAPVFYRNGLPNQTVDGWSEENAEEWEYPEEMTWARLRFYGITRVVLSVAHLDRNSKNNDRNNLAALCQRCHLKHDILQHIQNRRYGRHHAKEHQLKFQL